MFFIFLELSPPDAAAQPVYPYASGISFKGLLNGSMTIRYSREFLTAMVCNLLGLGEEEITGQSLEDCAKESINIVCGNFLAKLESEKALDLSIPVFHPDVKKLEAGGVKDSVILCFESDNGSLEVRMAVQDER
jgi:CheY-specific phosphatase CheX